MIGLDTNILVRHITQDERAQAELARVLIEERCRATAPGLVSLIVLCELVWVLTSAYGYARQQVAVALRQVLITDCFDVEQHALAWAALRDYEAGTADYADAVIARLHQLRGAETTYTFDKRAAQLPGFTLWS